MIVGGDWRWKAVFPGGEPENAADASGQQQQPARQEPYLGGLIGFQGHIGFDRIRSVVTARSMPITQKERFY